MQFRYGPLLILLAWLASPAFGQSAQAQDYPTRPVTLVVPYPAGGGLDALARQLGQKLADRLGKPVVIENRTGAGTVIGAASVAKAPPDGYTIMLGTSTPFAITATLNKSLPYDPAKDFAPIALTSNAPFLLLAHPSQPIHSVADLVRVAKEKPGQLSYGSAGPGSPQHLSFELLKSMTGIDVVHVPHRGDAPALTNLVAGHIPTMFGEPTPVLPLLKDGKRACARGVVDDAAADRARDPHGRGGRRSRLQPHLLADDRRTGGHAEGDHRPAACRGEARPGAPRDQGGVRPHRPNYRRLSLGRRAATLHAFRDRAFGKSGGAGRHRAIAINNQ